MIRRILSLMMVLILCACCVPAMADDGYAGQTYAGSTLLSSLTHNCPNTGIMLPSAFSPYQTTYLLTVADWVSRPTFTPVAMDPNAVITVNGRQVRSGTASQVIEMSDKPQAVTIQVQSGSASTTYTIYLQRRPSEKRTRVSAGFINDIYLKSTTWRIDADLVTLSYLGDDYESGNRSTYKNGGVDHYDYAVAPNCIFYYGTKQNPIRANNINEFMSYYQSYGSNFYTIIYIESEIVAVLPYGADY
ncbi:MAG: cadherin-like beta sandwich domain-containing protein [Clostridia bacterium]|nr:cadherin-like beta sandwich domain-containing protein [Clostridia bacterium]